MAWRLLIDDGVDAARGLATDEVLTREVGSGNSPPTLRLYTYRPHCALVGRFQDVANEIHLDLCSRQDIQVNRRPTGGGAILMGPDQLGVALAVRGHQEDLRPRELMSRFSAGLVRGLAGLGIRAQFRGKNDLTVDGRKIAGTGIYRDPSGGLLFHASLLVDMNVELMSAVLRVPFKKVVAGGLATVRKLLGTEILVEEVRSRIAAGFDLGLGAGELDPREVAAADTLVEAKYLTRAWLFPPTEAEVSEPYGCFVKP